jgi:two-component sensor histidine kinase
MAMDEAISPMNWFKFIVLLLFSVPLWGQGYREVLMQAQEAFEAQDMQKAESLYNKAASEALLRGDTVTAVKALMSLSDCRMGMGDIQKVVSTYRRCQDLAFQKEDTIWANALIGQATIHEIMGDKERSMALAREMIAYENTPVKELTAAYLILGDQLNDLGYPDSAEVYLDSALAQTVILPDSQAITTVHQTMGLLRHSKQDYEGGLYHFLRALDYYPSSLDSSGIPNIYNHIGRMYAALGQYAEAQAYSKEGMRLAKQFGAQTSYHQGAHVFAQASIETGDALTGIRMLEEVLGYFEMKNRPLYAYRTCLALTSAYIKKGDLTRARDRWNTARAYEESVEGFRLVLRKRLVEYDLLSAEGQLSQAESALEQAIGHLNENPSLNDESAVLQRRINLATRKGQFDQAFALQNELNRVNKEITSQARMRIIQEMNKYDQAQNEKEILRLSLKDEVNAAQIKRAQLRFWATLGLSLILLASLATFFFQFRRIKKQKEVIQSALSERETLLREIHHRVKNNLQVISSLLFLQAETVKDPKALAALQEGRNRVKSMSLIHQNLYQEDNLIGVNTKTYFDKLIGGLFTSYNIDRDRIKVHTDVQSLDVDIDTLVPLALIANELMSNSLKHAFGDDSKGNIYFYFHEDGDQLVMEQRDDGQGYSGSLETIKEDSFGFQLIEILSQKLRAETHISGKDGFRFSLKCPKVHPHV